MNPGYVTCSFTSKASYGSWRALATFSSRIGTTNPIGQFHVAYATRICPSALYGSWRELPEPLTRLAYLSRGGSVVAQPSRLPVRAFHPQKTSGRHTPWRFPLCGSFNPDVKRPRPARLLIAVA